MLLCAATIFRGICTSSWRSGGGYDDERIAETKVRMCFPGRHSADMELGEVWLARPLA